MKTKFIHFFFFLQRVLRGARVRVLFAFSLFPFSSYMLESFVSVNQLYFFIFYFTIYSPRRYAYAQSDLLPTWLMHPNVCWWKYREIFLLCERFKLPQHTTVMITTTTSKPHITSLSLKWEFCVEASDFVSCRFFVLTIDLSRQNFCFLLIYQRKVITKCDIDG